jgi:hypothetical protein
VSGSVTVQLDVVRYSAYDDNGFLGVQSDAYGEQESGIPDFECLGLSNFIGRPLDPQLDSAGEVEFGAHLLKLIEGKEWYGLPLYEPRTVPGLPALQKGEGLAFGPVFNFTRWHADGRISSMCTTDGTANGQRVFSELGPAGFVWAGPWAQLRHDALGVHYQHVSGASFDIGGISGVPAPLDRLSSYYTVTAAVISLRGTTVQLGVGTFEPAAKALTLLSVLAAQSAADAAQASADSLVAAALTAMQAVLSALPGGGAAAGPVAAAVAALSSASAAMNTAVTAITGATTTLPAKTTQVA